MLVPKVEPVEFVIRLGDDADLPFLNRMLRLAGNWSDDPAVDVDAMMARPEIAVLLTDWGRDGDTAVIAESSNGRPLGAAWYRYYTDREHSYGYIDEQTPEIAIAVEKEYRGQGIGSALLEELVAEAKPEAKGLSLSVDSRNYAVQLYRKAGFVNASDDSEDHWTMILRLA